jgi:PBP1b-binding outer membrane lipoprotein LpoB
MRRAFAVAALAAVLLTGCRTATSGDAAPNPAAPTTQPAATTTPAPPAATQPAAQVDSDLSSVDGLLGDLDDDASKADQAPPDGD